MYFFVYFFLYCTFHQRTSQHLAGKNEVQPHTILWDKEVLLPSVKQEQNWGQGELPKAKTQVAIKAGEEKSFC